MGNQASNQVSDEAIDITPITSSQLLKGIKGKVQTFSTISRLQNAVEALSKKLKKGTITNQYLVFQHVTEDNFAEFEEKRDKMSRAIRVTHCEDIDTLIIKVLTRAQETVINLFNLRFSNKISRTEVLSSAMFCI
jgi:basic membrane lipoprotein Med (substrate-binding protein (PBP1-ABC) superfamily)